MNIPGINEILKQMQSLDVFKADMAEQLERIAVAVERVADAAERLVELEESNGNG